MTHTPLAPDPAADVPCSIDYHRIEEARQWAETTPALRPWRDEVFDAFVTEVSAARPSRDDAACRVLELGAGPGFLAQRLLSALPGIAYVGLDVSEAMHALARERLGALAARARHVTRSLRDPAWTEGLAPQDVVVTNQVVHELRHKRHAVPLHRQVCSVLAPGGTYLVCDHWLGEGGMRNDRLYMTPDEQRDALRSAGFADVERVLLRGDLVLHRARRPSPACRSATPTNARGETACPTST